MDENTARYIVRMLGGFVDATLPLDATDEDAKEMDRMKKRYRTAGRWTQGAETAKAEFVMRIAANGVPGGDLLDADNPYLDRWLEQRGIPRIERPSKMDDMAAWRRWGDE